MFRVLGDVDLDPCADVDPEQHFADKNWHVDGNRPWHGRVFVNPPYSRLAMWVPLMSRPGPDAVVALIPPSTGTRYWHEHVFSSAQAVCFVAGRLSFRDPLTNEPGTNNRYDSAFVLWHAKGKIYQRFHEEYSQIGKVVVP